MGTRWVALPETCLRSQSRPARLDLFHSLRLKARSAHFLRCMYMAAVFPRGIRHWKEDFMKPKYAIFVMFVVMLFAIGMVAQSAAPAASTDSKACSCCSHDGAKADAKSCSKDGGCCTDGKCCDMKDGKMSCNKDCCKGMKDMAKGKSCCKDGKCEMAKAGKACCGDHCKMDKAS